MKGIQQNIRAALIVLLMIMGVSNASAALSVTLTNNSASTVGIGDEISLSVAARNFNYDYWGVYTFSYYIESDPTNIVNINTQTERYPYVSYKFKPTKAGKYHFKVTLTYSGTSISSTSNDVPITVAPPTVSLAADQTVVDAGNTITLTATPGYITPTSYTYSYSTNNGKTYTQIVTSSSNTATYIPTQAGTYLFKVEASDGTNKAKSESVSVTASAVEPRVIFTVTPDKAELNSTLTLTVTPICCNPTAYYFRRKISDNGYRLISSMSNPTSNVCTYTPSETGTYVFTVIVDYKDSEDNTVSLYETSENIIVGRPSGINYIDENGEEQVCPHANEVVTFMGSVTWPKGWYVVNGVNVEIGDGVTCTGDVNLILTDGSKLTITASNDGKSGISVGEGNTLTIYGQENGSGELIVSGNTHCAGIGDTGENVIINGGTITATGGYLSPGIGSSYRKTLNSVTINGGTITATGNLNAAGIGSGLGEQGEEDNPDIFSIVGSITINGGTITATGGEKAAGIGCGQLSECNSITINGGTITAKGGVDATGIGTSDTGYCGDIKINGGTVTASRGDIDDLTCPAIGRSHFGTCTGVYINKDLVVFADNSSNPTTLFNNSGENIGETLTQQYVSIPGTKILPSVTLNAKGLATYSAGSNATIYTPVVNAYTATVNGTTIYLYKIEDDILKDNGVVLLGAAGTTVQILESTKTDITNSDNDLKPTTTSSESLVSVPNSGFNYVMGSDGLFHPYTGITFAANRAYFNLATNPLAAQGAKFIMLFSDNENTTAIEEVNTAEGQQTKTYDIYNIAGQKVSKNYKGLVIINGKKILK